MGGNNPTFGLQVTWVCAGSQVLTSYLTWPGAHMKRLRGYFAPRNGTSFLGPGFVGPGRAAALERVVGSGSRPPPSSLTMLGKLTWARP